MATPVAEAPRVGVFDAEGVLRNLHKTLWDFGANDLIHPFDYRDWGHSAAELSKGAFSAPRVSDVDVELYTMAFERYLTYFARIHPHKFATRLQQISTYFLPSISLTNVGDKDDGPIEIEISCDRGASLCDVEEIRAANDWGLSYPRPRLLEFDLDKVESQDVGSSAASVVSGNDTRRKYRVERLLPFHEVSVPICAKVGTDVSVIDVVVKSRKSGQRQTLRIETEHPKIAMDFEDILFLFDRAADVMPREQAHIFRNLVSLVRDYQIKADSLGADDPEPDVWRP